MVTKYTSGVVGQGMFGMRSRIDVPSTAVSRRSNRLVLLDSEHRLQILLTTTNYANVAALQHGVSNAGHRE